MASGDVTRQRHFDEDQRLVDQRRVEERVAAPVGRIDAPAQIVPVVDFVHRLVANDLLEHDRGRRPVDPAQHQEAAVEPSENRCTKSASTAARSSRCSSALSSCSRIATSALVPPGARLSRRSSSWRRGSAAACSSAAVASLGFARQASTAASMPRTVRPEPGRQRLEERDARPGGQVGVARENFARERDARSLAAPGEELFAQFDQGLGPLGGVIVAAAPAVDQRAAALRNRSAEVRRRKTCSSRTHDRVRQPGRDSREHT